MFCRTARFSRDFSATRIADHRGVAVKMSMQELKTHIQLLTDVLALRRAIELMLNPSILVSLRNGDDVYMSI
jgi:hypothetical protein